MATPWRTTHPLIERWRPSDARRLLLARLDSSHDATIGFYSRRDGWAPTTSQREFIGRATHLAAWLRANEVERGDPLIVVGGHPETQLSLYVGAVLAGALPSIYPARPAFSPAQELGHGLLRALAAHGRRARVVADAPIRSVEHVDLWPLVVDVASFPSTPRDLDAPRDRPRYAAALAEHQRHDR